MLVGGVSCAIYCLFLLRCMAVTHSDLHLKGAQRCSQSANQYCVRHICWYMFAMPGNICGSPSKHHLLHHVHPLCCSSFLHSSGTSGQQHATASCLVKMCLNLLPIYLLSSGVVTSLGRAIEPMNDVINCSVNGELGRCLIGLAKKQYSFFVPSNNSQDGDICM